MAHSESCLGRRLRSLILVFAIVSYQAYVAAAPTVFAQCAEDCLKENPRKHVPCLSACNSSPSMLGVSLQANQRCITRVEGKTKVKLKECDDSPEQEFWLMKTSSGAIQIAGDTLGSKCVGPDGKYVSCQLAASEFLAIRKGPNAHYLNLLPLGMESKCLQIYGKSLKPVSCSQERKVRQEWFISPFVAGKVSGTHQIDVERQPASEPTPPYEAQLPIQAPTAQPTPVPTTPEPTTAKPTTAKPTPSPTRRLPTPNPTPKPTPNPTAARRTPAPTLVPSIATRGSVPCESIQLKGWSSAEGLFKYDDYATNFDGNGAREGWVVYRQKGYLARTIPSDMSDLSKNEWQVFEFGTAGSFEPIYGITAVCDDSADQGPTVLKDASDGRSKEGTGSVGKDEQDDLKDSRVLEGSEDSNSEDGDIRTDSERDERQEAGRERDRGGVQGRDGAMVREKENNKETEQKVEFCPKGWVAANDGWCYNFFQEKRPFSGVMSAYYGCQNWGNAFLLSSNDVVDNSTLTELVPRGTNFWLDSGDYLKTWDFDSRELPSEMFPEGLPYVCRIKKGVLPTSFIGQSDACQCGMDTIGQYCGPIGAATYCCLSAACIPREPSADYPPGMPCAQSRPCQSECFDRTTAPFEAGFCTANCPCFNGEGPCSSTSDCFSGSCLQGICSEVNGITGPQRSEIKNPLNTCNSHDACPHGMYCDSRQLCWSCTGVYEGNCDSFDGSCTTRSFSDQCSEVPKTASSASVSRTENGRQPGRSERPNRERPKERDRGGRGGPAGGPGQLPNLQDMGAPAGGRGGFQTLVAGQNLVGGLRGRGTGGAPLEAIGRGGRARDEYAPPGRR